MIGRTLGHYQVIEKIGEGGMGVVYRVHDQRLERDVALKVLPAGALADPAARKRFRNEALALARYLKLRFCRFARWHRRHRRVEKSYSGWACSLS